MPEVENPDTALAMASAALPSAGAVLPVDKAEGPTSHDIVAQARRALHTRRIGHTGTLDPFASGLLLLCLGPATRLAEYLTALPKTYRALMRLGEATDTDDLTGQLLRRSDGWRALPENTVSAALTAQLGTIEQLPPLFSAKKVAGERMHAAARRGETPERTPVRVTIHRIEVLASRLPDVEFEVVCSSGTYIRAIARDVGEALGTGAHLRALRRTQIGAHAVEGAVPVERLGDLQAVRHVLLSPLAALAHMQQVVVDAAAATTVAHGGAIPARVELPEGARVLLASSAGELLAVGEAQAGYIQPRKVFR